MILFQWIPDWTPFPSWRYSPTARLRKSIWCSLHMVMIINIIEFSLLQAKYDSIIFIHTFDMNRIQQYVLKTIWHNGAVFRRHLYHERRAHFNSVGMICHRWKKILETQLKTQLNSQLRKLTRTRTQSDRIKLAEQSLINLIQRRFLIRSLTSTQTTWTAKSSFEDDKSFSLDIRTLSQDIPLVVEAARDD